MLFLGCTILVFDNCSLGKVDFFQLFDNMSQNIGEMVFKVLNTFAKLWLSDLGPVNSTSTSTSTSTIQVITTTSNNGTTEDILSEASDQVNPI